MTAVTIKFTGLVRSRAGTGRMDFDFDGDTLGELLSAFFARHDLREMLFGEDGKLRPYARVLVNGRFSYLVGDMEAKIQDGDVIVLMRPYAVAF